MPGLICAQKNCVSTQHSAGIILHVFPRFDPHRQQWIEFMGQYQGWQPKTSSRVCSLHFRDSEYYIINGNRRLKPTAVPTVSMDCEEDSFVVTEGEKSYSQLNVSQDYGQNKSTQ